jgi:hypothetical protein
MTPTVLKKLETPGMTANESNQPPVRLCSGLSWTGVAGAARNTREDFDRLAL